MKWLFSLLLLANIALLMWGSWYLGPDVPASKPAQPEIRPEQMRLLSEPGAELLPHGMGGATPAPVLQATGCYRVGPFRNGKAATHMRERLVASEVSVRPYEDSERTVTGYRVYLPPFPSREAAERQRKALTRLGFRDHALMNEEGMRNAISLGLFTVEANARNHLRELEEKKISARLETLYRTRTVYWLDLRAEPQRVTLEQLKQAVGDTSGVRLESYVCDNATAVPTPAAKR